MTRGRGPRAAAVGTWLVVAFLAGTAAGLLLGERAAPLRVLGDLLLWPLRILAPVAVAVFLVQGLAGASALALGSLGGRLAAWFVSLSLGAASCGALVAGGVSMAWPMDAPVALPAFAETGAARDALGPWGRGWTVEAWLLPLVVAAAAAGLLLGWARARWPEGPPGTLAAAVAWTARALSVGLGWVMYYAPVGTFALAAVAFGTASRSLARGFITTMVAVTVGHAVLLLLMAVLLAYGRGGAWRTIWAAREALVTALATGSSAASLPVEVRVAERLGVSMGHAALAIPFGVTFSKVGSTCYIAGLTVMGLAFTGQSVWPALPLVTALAALAGLFTPPISGGSFVMLGFLFAEAGVPLALVPLFTSVPFMAKANTPLNALGRLVATLAVSRAAGDRIPVARRRQTPDAGRPPDAGRRMPDKRQSV